MAMGEDVCSKKPLDVVKQQPLNIPRSGHRTFIANGEPIVFGGHTSGFVPTPTAEYFADGKWHTLNTIYPHDQGFAVALKSGQIMLGGGHEKSLGIGHIFSVERYDPTTRTFDGFGCLDRKRCFAEALEMDSGCVVVAGNWYEQDLLEQFCDDPLFSKIKDLPQSRPEPYILRTAKDNAIIFGSSDGKGNPLDAIIVDRLSGESFVPEIFNSWRPLYNLIQNYSPYCFVGDEQRGIYSYLLPAFNSAGQMAIIKSVGEDFSLLPTATPIPMRSRFGKINYFSYVIADRTDGKAYIVGHGDKNDKRYYVLSVEYTKSPSPITLYYSEPQYTLSAASFCLLSALLSYCLSASTVKLPRQLKQNL